MKKRQLLICNYSLLLVMVIVVASGIVLECIHGKEFMGIGNHTLKWTHIIMSIALIALAWWHVRLNWNSAGNWAKRFASHRSRGFQLTAILFLATALTGLVSIAIWLTHGHTVFGGVHGMIGFVCALFVLSHIIGHRKWF